MASPTRIEEPTTANVEVMGGTLVQEFVARYLDEESRFLQAVNRAQTRYNAAVISRMGRWPFVLTTA
ncbi:MAG TPA: hypothetical protein VH325_13965 [Bryobacteraceae bacterium]|nr:hypothetical protein [Bryobacteraceae bacterium]